MVVALYIGFSVRVIIYASIYSFSNEPHKASCQQLSLKH